MRDGSIQGILLTTLLLLFLSACGTARETTGVSVSVDPDGVRAVENGSVPRVDEDPLPLLVLEDEWRLGGDPELEETQFFYLPPEAIAEGPQQQVGVVNMRHHQVRVFDRTGSPLWKAGREGEGPGEFRLASELTYQEGLGWVVSERVGGRKTVFGDNGRYARTLNLANLPYALHARRLQFVDSGRFWYRGHRNLIEDGSTRMEFHLIAGELQGLQAQEIHTFSQPSVEQEEGKLFFLEQWPAVVTVDRGGRAWVVSDLPYQIEVFAHDGQEHFRIRREHELKDYDAAFRKAFESDWQRYAMEPIIWGRLPGKQPAIREISRGPDGEMWVFNHAWVDSPLVQVDVFTEEGIYERAFLADVGLAGFTFHRDHVYRSQDKEGEVPYLIRSRYRFERP